MTHGYFTAKARAAFDQAGGDPDLSVHLAEWAESAKATGDPRRGVIIAETGEILAQTRYMPNAHATYATEASDPEDNRLINGVKGLEVGLAVETLTRRHGPCVHVKYSEVCQGAGKLIPQVTS